MVFCRRRHHVPRVLIVRSTRFRPSHALAGPIVALESRSQRCAALGRTVNQAQDRRRYVQLGVTVYQMQVNPHRVLQADTTV